MSQWLQSWDEAARHPWATVIRVSVLGLVAGGVYGYFGFGDNPGYGIALGVGLALVVGVQTWRIVRDPGRVTELTERRRAPLRGAATCLALPFIALVVAVIAGAASASATVFVFTLAAGLAVGFVVGRFTPR